MFEMYIKHLYDSFKLFEELHRLGGFPESVQRTCLRDPHMDVCLSEVHETGLRGQVRNTPESRRNSLYAIA